MAGATPVAAMASPRRMTTPAVPARRARTGGTSNDFFRHMVVNMRNGVLAINPLGQVVLINDEAYRTFELPADLDYLGQPFADVFRSHPDIVRVLGGAFEMAALPNRAELRLKPTGKVIGYTLSLIRDERDSAIGLHRNRYLDPLDTGRRARPRARPHHWLRQGNGRIRPP